MLNNKPKTNEEKATEFLSVVGEDQNIIKHFIHYVFKKYGINDDEYVHDFYNETFLTCYDAILKGGHLKRKNGKGKFISRKDYKNYFYSSLRNNFINHNKDHQKENNSRMEIDDLRESVISECFVPFDEPIINQKYDYNLDTFLFENDIYTEQIYYESDIDEKKEDLRKLHHLINSLPEKYKEVIRLQINDKMEYKEIAEELNIPMSTVKNRIHHAKKLIIQAKKNKYPDDE